MLGSGLKGQEPMKFQSSSKERLEALFYPAEVAKHTVLLPRQLLMESSHVGAVNLPSLQADKKKVIY